MTQIKKTLSIAGIIALVTAPAMADIASTAYVQSIVNNIPKPAAATASSAGLTKLYTGVGTNTDGAMTQAAVKTELDKKLGNTATGTNNLAIGGATATIVHDEEYNTDEYSLAIGSGANAKGGIAIGVGANSKADAYNGEYYSGGVAIGMDAQGNNGVAIGADTKVTYGGTAIGNFASSNNSNQDSPSVAIGESAHATSYGSVAIGGLANAAAEAIAVGTNADANHSGGIAIGYNSRATGDDSIVIGDEASVGGREAIMLGHGVNNLNNSFAVGIDWNDRDEPYVLLKHGGVIPAARLTAASFDEDGIPTEYNGLAGQLLQTNGDGTMSWVNAPAPSLDAILPTAPNNCKASDGQQCALVMTWSSSQNKFTYSWEVVKISE